MKILVTGSSGHLGEALVRELRELGHQVVGMDVLPAKTTSIRGSIADRAAVRDAMEGVTAVVHTATLHKPHVATHPKQAFVDTNVTGTLVLLEEAVRAGVDRFVYTSTTSAFGNALRPHQPQAAVWVTEDLKAVPRNIYGVTKTAAEDICELVAEEHGLPCIVLRTSRFFPEEDDMAHTLPDFADANIKANEYLYRRVDIADVASAHVRALERAGQIGFGKFIVSATTPFKESDCESLLKDAPAVVAREFPDYPDVYARMGFRMFGEIGRVYVNDKAREQLGWQPRYDFAHVLESLRAGESPLSPLARTIGSKGYHRK